jgi:hydrogenase maturation protease
VAGKLLVVALGNPLMGDDGVGPAVAAALNTRIAHAGVRVEDGGTDALRIPSLWQGEGEVWLIDAVRRGGPAGTVHRIDHGALLASPQRHEGAHRLSLPECLRWLTASCPELAEVRYRLWGVEVGTVATGAPLSPGVASIVERLAAEIAAAAGELVAAPRGAVQASRPRQ